MSHCYVHCLIAGVSAAGASISAKLLTSPTLDAIPTNLRYILCVAGIIISNLVLWANFTVAMQGLRTVVAMSLTTAINFITSALVGFLLFGESVSMDTQGLGTLLILLGVIFLSTDGENHTSITEGTEVDEKEQEKDTVKKAQ